MNKFFLFCLPFLVFISLKSAAQVGIGTTTPDASAQLELKSATKGLLIPRVNSTGDVTGPANGLLVYQTGGTAGFYYNSGSAGSPVWLLLSTNSSTTPTGSAGGDLTGDYPNPTLASGAITSAKVADGAITLPKVNASGASAGQVLTYNGTNVVWATPTRETSNTSYLYATNLTGSILPLFPSGMDVPMYDNVIGENVDVNGTKFIIVTSGTYRINYSINLNRIAEASSRLMRNDQAVPASVVYSPLVARNSYTAEVILNLSAGDRLSVQLVGFATVDLAPGQGAAITIQQLR